MSLEDAIKRRIAANGGTDLKAGTRAEASSAFRAAVANANKKMGLTNKGETARTKVNEKKTEEAERSTDEKITSEINNWRQSVNDSLDAESPAAKKAAKIAEAKAPEIAKREINDTLGAETVNQKKNAKMADAGVDVNQYYNNVINKKLEEYQKQLEEYNKLMSPDYLAELEKEYEKLSADYDQMQRNRRNKVLRLGNNALPDDYDDRILNVQKMRESLQSQIEQAKYLQSQKRSDDLYNSLKVAPDFYEVTKAANSFDPKGDPTAQAQLRRSSKAISSLLMEDVFSNPDLYTHMKNEEVKTYVYLYEKQGKDKAHEYYESIKPTLTYREQGYQSEMLARFEKDASENFLYGLIGSLASVPVNIVGGVGSAVEDVFGGDGTDMNSGFNRVRRIGAAFRSGAGIGIDNTFPNAPEVFDQKLGSFLYNAGMSTVDSLAGVVTLGKLYTVAMGMGAFANEFDEQLQKGKTQTEAFMNAISSGVAEALFEYVSVDKLVNMKTPASKMEAVKNVLVQMGIEGSEEINTEIANIITDSLISGPTSEYQTDIRKYMEQGMSLKQAEDQAIKDRVKSTLAAGLAGAISGGMSAGAMTGLQTAFDYHAGQEIRKTDVNGEYTDALIEAGQTAASKGQDENASHLVDAIRRAQERGRTPNPVALGALENNQNVQNVIDQETQKLLGEIAELERKAKENPEDTPYRSYQATPGEEHKNASRDKLVSRILLTNEIKPGDRGIIKRDSSVNVNVRDELRAANYRGIKQLANLGYNFVLYESTKADRDAGVPNGWYDGNTNTVYLDLKAGKDGAGTVLFTAGHELTHAIKTNAEEQYRELESVVRDIYAEQGKSFDEAVEQRYQKLDKTGRITANMTEEEARALATEETIADSMETMFTDGNVFENLADHKSLLQTVIDFIKRTIAKIKAIYSKLTPDSAEGKFIRDAQGALERLEGIYTEGVRRAANGRQVNNGTETAENNKNAAENGDTANDGQVKYSDREKQSTLKKQILDSSKALNEMKPAFSFVYDGKEFQNKNQARKWAKTVLKKYGGAIDRQNFGRIYFNENDIDAVIAHLDDYSQQVAIAAVPMVLKRGIQIGEHTNHKGRDKSTITFGAPIEIDGIRGNMGVVVNLNGNHLYAERVLLPDGTAFDLRKTKEASERIAQGVRNEPSLAEPTDDASKDSISQTSANVNTFDKKFSDRDSDGNELSAEQQEFFKDSKIRDKNGDLLVVYHGTDADFNTFSYEYGGKTGRAKGYGFYLTPSKTMAKHYGGRVIEAYANIKRVIYNDQKTITKPELKKFVSALINYDIKRYKSDGLTWQDSFISNYVYTYGMSKQAAISEFVDIVLSGNDNDSDIIYEIAIADGMNDSPLAAEQFYNVLTDSIGFDGAWYGDEIVAFRSSQIKNTDNKTPTGSKDIRYSDRDVENSGSARAVLDAEEAARDDLERENMVLRDNIQTLRNLLRVQKSVVFTRQSVDPVTRKLMAMVGADKNHNKIGDALKDYYTWMGNHKKITTEDALERAGGIASLIVSSVTPKRDDYNQQIYDMMRTARFSLNDKQKGEAASMFGTYENFRRRYFGKLGIVRDGISLDQIWQEWSEQFPGMFDADVSDTDMVEQVVRIFDRVASTFDTDALIDDTATMQSLTYEIFRKYWEASGLDTLDAKYQEKAKEFDRRLSEASRQYRQTVNELKTTARKAERDAQFQRERADRTQLRRSIKRKITLIERRLSHTNKNYNVKNGLKGLAESALSVGKALLAQDGTNLDIFDLLDTTEFSREQTAAAGVINNFRNLITELEKSAETDDNAQVQIFNMNKEIENILRDKFQKEISEARKKISEVTMGDAFEQLRDAYGRLPGSGDTLAEGAFDRTVYEHLNSIARNDELKQYTLRRMNLDNLKQVYNAFSMVCHTITTADKLFKDGREIERAEIAHKIIDDVKKSGKPKDRSSRTSAIRQFKWKELKPIYAFRMIGSDTMTKELFMPFITADGEIAKKKNKITQVLKNAWDKTGMKPGDLDEIHTFKTISGVEIKITTNQLMKLYALSKREQAVKHIVSGGITITKLPGKHGRTIELAQNGSTRLDEQADLPRLTALLTKEQRAFVDELGRFEKTLAEWGNKVSMMLYGIELFTEDNYSRITSDSNLMANEPDTDSLGMTEGMKSLENAGFTQAVNPNAKNAIQIDDFLSDWVKHAMDMANYSELVIPLKNLRRVMYYTDADDIGVNGVKTAIQSIHGDQALSYIAQFIRLANGGSTPDYTGPVSQMISTFKKTATAASLSTVIQQPTAIIRAMAYINPKYFIKRSGTKDATVNKKALQTTYNELKKWAPIGLVKEQGGYDMGTGMGSVAAIITEAVGEKNKTKRVLNTIDDYSMWLASEADVLGWNTIWNAVKSEIAETKPELEAGSDAYFKACGERFTEVVALTQVYDSVFSRSQIMMSKDALTKIATAFMAEPTTSLNMMVDAIAQTRRGNMPKGRAVRIFGSVIAASIATAAAASIIYAMRDDDDDESFAEKYAEAFVGKLIDELNFVNMIPYVRDIWSLLQGYDIERTDMSTISDIIDSTRRLILKYAKGQEVGANDYLSVAGDAASLFGLPLKNIIRDTRGIYNGISDIFDGINPSGTNIGEAAASGAADSLPIARDLWKPEADKNKKIYRAMTTGDEARLRIYRNGYKTEESFRSAVVKGLAENEPRIREAALARMSGDMATYKRLVREIMAEGVFDQDTCVLAVNRIINAEKDAEKAAKKATEEAASETEAETVTSIYSASDIETAFAAGRYGDAKEIIDELISVKMQNGKTETEARAAVKSSVTQYLKKRFINAYKVSNTREFETIKDMMVESGLYGRRSDAADTLREWRDEYKKQQKKSK